MHVDICVSEALVYADIPWYNHTLCPQRLLFLVSSNVMILRGTGYPDSIKRGAMKIRAHSHFLNLPKPSTFLSIHNKISNTVSSEVIWYIIGVSVYPLSWQHTQLQGLQSFQARTHPDPDKGTVQPTAGQVLVYSKWLFATSEQERENFLNH